MIIIIIITDITIITIITIITTISIDIIIIINNNNHTITIIHKGISRSIRQTLGFIVFFMFLVLFQVHYFYCLVFICSFYHFLDFTSNLIFRCYCFLYDAHIVLLFMLYFLLYFV